MQNINELAIEIREVGEANGWTLTYRPDWDSSETRVPAMLALIHSELSEAYLELVQGSYQDRDDLGAEFADVVIRTLDLAGAFTEDFQHFVKTADRCFVPEEAGRAINTFHVLVTQALEDFRDNEMVDFLKTLAVLVLAVEKCARNVRIDLYDAVIRKIDVNKHRSHRHGGKRI